MCLPVKARRSAGETTAKEEELTSLTQAGQKIEAHYAKQLEDLDKALEKQQQQQGVSEKERVRDVILAKMHAAKCFSW